MVRNFSGVSVNENAMEELEQVSDRTSTERVTNKLSGRTENRTTYYLNGLDICTITRSSGKVVEIQKGLLNHPIVDRLSQ